MAPNNMLTDDDEDPTGNCGSLPTRFVEIPSQLQLGNSSGLNSVSKSLQNSYTEAATARCDNHSLYPLAQCPSPPSIVDEDSLNLGVPVDDHGKKICGPRTAISSLQLELLELRFQKNRYPDCFEYEEVANSVGLSRFQVENWFENRRVKHQNEVAAAAAGIAASSQQDEESSTPKGSSTLCQGNQIAQENPAEFNRPLFEAEKRTFYDQAERPKAVHIEEQSEHSYVAAPIVGSRNSSAYQSAHCPSPRDVIQVDVREKRKRITRKRLSYLQLEQLKCRFQQTKYLTVPERAELAASVGLSLTQVTTWFQNQRLKYRKMMEAEKLVISGGGGNLPSDRQQQEMENYIPNYQLASHRQSGGGYYCPSQQQLEEVAVEASYMTGRLP